VRNIAEEIAYWYLRLNYFFLVDNFVVHQGRGTEHDLLALRLAGAKEVISNKELQTDERRFEKCFAEVGSDGAAESNLLGLVVQVKGGLSTAADTTGVFSEENLRYPLLRFGIDDASATSRLVRGEPYISRFGLVVCTMLAKRRGAPQKGDAGITVDLEDMLAFLRNRAREEAGEHRKSRSDWHLFEGGIFQYFLLEERLQRGSSGG